MNRDVLKEALRPWMWVETWHTDHPLDDERFHKALSTAFDKLGVNIPGGEFEDVMSELAKEFHPDWDEDCRKETVRQFAVRAEHISSYLSDTKGIY